MMAVLSPASPVPKDERRTFIKDRVSAIAEVLQKSNIRLGLEFLGPMYFRSNEKYPHTFMYTLPETVALAESMRPQHRRHARRLALASFRRAPLLKSSPPANPASSMFTCPTPSPAPPEEVRDNQRHMPGEGVIDLVGFFQALKKVGYVDGVSPEPLGRVPAEMSPEEGARLGLETTRSGDEEGGAV